MLTEQGSMARYQHQLSAVPLAESFVLIYNYVFVTYPVIWLCLP